MSSSTEIFKSWFFLEYIFILFSYAITHRETERLHKLNRLNCQYWDEGVNVSSFNSMGEKRTTFHFAK